MLRSGLKWARRLVIVGTVVALVRRTLGRPSRTSQESVPSVSGDTWPPVPSNPDRQN